MLFSWRNAWKVPKQAIFGHSIKEEREEFAERNTHADFNQILLTR